MRCIVISCIVGLSQACSIFGASEQSIEGFYQLVALADAPLPVNLHELPTSPTDVTPSGCYLTLTEGYLELGPPGRTFLLRIVHRHSCLGHVLSDQSTIGEYERKGSRLVLTKHGSTMDFVYNGTIAGDRITVDKEGKIYHLERAAGQ